MVLHTFYGLNDTITRVKTYKTPIELHTKPITKPTSNSLTN